MLIYCRPVCMCHDLCMPQMFVEQIYENGKKIIHKNSTISRKGK